MHVMVDIETLDKTPDALILTMAAQKFDPFGRGYREDLSLSLRLSIESQPDRSVNDETIEWWARQSDEAREAAFGDGDRVTLQDGLAQLHKIIWNSTLVWMNSPSFDAVILEHAYASLGMPKPWQYWNLRDTRTLYSLVPDLTIPPVEHDALADGRRQIIMVQDALDFLKVRRMK